jgi:arylsulfatase A-like enzyme
MPPNIVLFLTDDHGAWALRCAGNGEVRTPNLDRLASRGVRFTDAITPCPVCSPARACVMTGRTPSQHGVHDYLAQEHPDVRDRDWLGDEATLAELLRDAGYWTALSGKWHVGYPWTPPPGFDRAMSAASQYPHNGDLEFHLDGERITRTGNRSTAVTDQAVAFLEQRDPNKPFFLNVGLTATHSPYEDEKHDPALVESYRDATFADIPRDPPHPWHKNEGLAGGDLDDEDAITRRFRGYYAAVTEIDREVGRLLDYLDEHGLSDDTLVIYTGDHGCALGHQGFWGKGNSTRPLNMYEISLRIPLIARWPNRAGWHEGHLRDTPVDQYDLFQTLLDAAGVAPPIGRDYPGFSFLDPAWQRSTPRFGEYGDLRMIRTDRHKLVWRFPDGPHELFDLVDDPRETRNLAGDPNHAPLQARLTAQLNAWYRMHQTPANTGLRVKEMNVFNARAEAWRDGLREDRGLQVY